MQMEHAQLLMWPKRSRLSSHLKSPTGVSYDDSWEEQAFAEDAAGPLGGCIWPPRSYSCSFCRREFRSAQALGGHMNVHRRDRARLKQSPLSHNENPHPEHQNHPNNHCQDSFLPLGFSCPDQLFCNPNPSAAHGALTSSASPPRVSAPSNGLGSYYGCTTIVKPYFSSTLNESHSPTMISSFPSRSNSVSQKCYPIIDINLNEEKNSSTLDQSGERAKADLAKTDLAESLNLFVQSRPALSSGEEEAISLKRRRTDASLPFFLRTGTVKRHHIQPAEICEIKPRPIEDLDLELRLGDRPKVKLQS